MISNTRTWSQHNFFFDLQSHKSSGFSFGLKTKYRFLHQKSIASYLVSSIKPNDFYNSPRFEELRRKRLKQVAESFVCLDEDQIQTLATMSETLGIPLSPVGIITFTSGVIVDMSMFIDGFFCVQNIGGQVFEAESFAKGSSSHVGFWFAQSDSAADQTHSDLTRIEKTKSGPLPERSSIFFPPTEQDFQGVNVTHLEGV